MVWGWQARSKTEKNKRQHTAKSNIPMFIYKGSVEHVSIVKSVRLKTSLCSTLQTDVQPIQFRVALDYFREACRTAAQAEVWEQCFENDEGTLYPNLIGEYVCGVSSDDSRARKQLSRFEIPGDPVTLHLSPSMQLRVDLQQPLLLTFLTPDLDLTPKYRKGDGQQMRTLPPEWKGSRRLWRLHGATLVEVLYTTPPGADCFAPLSKTAPATAHP